MLDDNQEKLDFKEKLFMKVVRVHHNETGKSNILLSLRVNSRGLEHVIRLKGQNLVNRDFEWW